MKLRQLQYIVEVARHELNITATAESLFTSQPGVSKQIRQLEDELGVQIFERRGRQLTKITKEGQAIIELAEKALGEIDTLKQAAQEFRDPEVGNIALAGTHTVARYIFPPAVQAFSKRFPRVNVHIHTGTPLQIASMVNSGDVDFGIATESMEYFEDLISIPCYRWRRSVLVPKDHPLVREPELTLENIARYPIITYVFGFDQGAPLDQAFSQRGLHPEVHFSATDADIVKAMVRLNMGVGIVATLAHDPDWDTDLVALDGSHLFEVTTAQIVFRRDIFFRKYMFAFLTELAPHLTEESIETALNARNQARLGALFADTDIPLY